MLISPRSGAEDRRTPCPKGGSQEELPHVRSQGQRRRVPDCDGAGTAQKSYPASEVRGGGERSYLASEVRGGGQEEIPHAPSPRPGAAGGRTNPTSKEPWLRGHRKA